MSTNITGVQCLVMTPFTAQDDIDEEGFRKGIDFALDGGADGIVVIGRVGEYYGLTVEERKRAIDIAQAHVAGRAPLGFGVMDATYDEGLDLTRYGAKLGVDFVLSRGAVDRDPVEYYAAISAELPTIIYDYAEKRQLTIKEVLSVLGKCDNLVGAKISGPPDKIGELKKHTELPLLCGWDMQSHLAYRFGADGVVSGSAAVFPKLHTKHSQLCVAGRWDEAADLFFGRILPCMNYLGADPYGPAAYKTVLMWQGVIKNPRPRPPFEPLNPTRQAILRQVIEWAGLLS